MDIYKKEKFPENAGMIDSHIVIRNFGDPRVRTMSCEWFHQINIGSRRDQLSFNYVIWKLNHKDIVRYEHWGKFVTNAKHVYVDLP